MKPKTTVEKKPPMKPSQVFLGESCRDRHTEDVFHSSLTTKHNTERILCEPTVSLIYEGY